MMASTKVQEIREQGSVYKVLSPVLNLCKVTGLAPYRLITYDGIEINDIKLSIPTAIYSGLLASFIVYGLVENIIDEIKYLSTMKILRVIVTRLSNIVLIYLTTVTNMIMTIMFNHKYMKGVVTTIESVDTVLLKMFVTHSKKTFNLPYVNAFITFLGFVAYIITKGFSYSHRNVSYTIIFASTINLVIKITVISQRLVIIKIIESKFKILNGILENMSDKVVITRVIDNDVKYINTEGSNSMDMRQKPNNVEQESLGGSQSSLRGSDIQIRALALCHHRLTDVTLTVNAMYGFAYLLDIFATFVHVTSCVSYGICAATEICGGNEFKLYGILMLTVWWGIINIAKALLTIQFCNDAKAESLDTVRIANELLLTKDLSVDDKDQLKMLVSQVRSREVTFTATGFITLDYSFLSSMLGAVATYILVIIQFDPVY
ncbi:hypothetical protein PR048_032424 [Dryococelus australis]|uniref:Gustatory receptor n=1 Tax=Dryococelus australis TaxID=614101 RepID=A0ABQ9G258_9NEOP|nr:hypothetical protein PR048_032424 [Dryococelus australis]